MTIEEIEEIIAGVKGLNNAKKLIDIVNYLNKKYEAGEFVLEVPEDLLGYQNFPFDADDVDVLFHIINQSYSIGDPYFIFELTLTDRTEQNQLIQNITEELNNYRLSDYYQITNCHEINEEFPNHMSIRVHFDQYQVVSTRNGLERTYRIRYGYFDCHFLFENNILLINSGDQKLAKSMLSFFTFHFYRDLGLIPFIIPTTYTYIGPMDANRTNSILVRINN